MQIITDFLNAGYFAGYVDARAIANGGDMMLERFFPVKKIPGLEYSYIKTTKGAVELSIASSYDAEPITQNRESFDAMKGDLPLFRRKMVLSEKEKMMINNAMTTQNAEYIGGVIGTIYDDRYTLVEGALWTQEYLRAKALIDGKIVLSSNGGAVNVDYKVPADNKYTLTGTDAWSDPTAPILDQIKAWIDKVYMNTGIKPDAMLLNQTTFQYLVNNEQIRNNLIPLSLLVSNVADSIALSDRQIMESVKAFCGLREILVYDRNVNMDGVISKLIPDNKVSIFPSGKVGETLVGTSPAELSVYVDGNTNVSITNAGIAVANVVNTTGAPYRTETQVEVVTLPSFLMSDFTVLATVA